MSTTSVEQVKTTAQDGFGSAGKPPSNRRQSAVGDRLYRVIWRWHFYAGMIIAPMLIVVAATGALYILMRSNGHGAPRNTIAQRGRHADRSENGSTAIASRPPNGAELLIAQGALGGRQFQHELSLVIGWYNGSQPHTALSGCTPDEVYQGTFPAVRRPRWEPRSRWPKNAPCARPWALTRGRPGANLMLQVDYLQGRRHLPVVTLSRAA